MASSDPKPGDKAAETKPEEKPQQKSAGSLEEDDEFEDFPVEGSLFCYVSLLPPPSSTPSSLPPVPCFDCRLETL